MSIYVIYATYSLQSSTNFCGMDGCFLLLEHGKFLHGKGEKPRNRRSNIVDWTRTEFRNSIMARSVPDNLQYPMKRNKEAQKSEEECGIQEFIPILVAQAQEEKYHMKKSNFFCNLRFCNDFFLLQPY